MKLLICWLIGHDWLRVSYAPTYDSSHQWWSCRTKECLRCGADEVEIRAVTA